MELYEAFVGRRLSDRPAIFALGGFDGLHRGHTHLLEHCTALARDVGAQTVVLTFSGLQEFFPRSGQIISTTVKRRLLAQRGVDILIDVPFSQQLKDMSALQFIEKLCTMMSIHTWVGGHDLHFGKDREGSSTFLAAYGAEHGLRTLLISRILDDGEEISSSHIRQHIAKGRLARASVLLGRPYSFESVCVPADSSPFCAKYTLDGSGLCLPPAGAYPVTVLSEGSRAVVSIGSDGGVELICRSRNHALTQVEVVYQ